REHARERGRPAERRRLPGQLLVREHRPQPRHGEHRLRHLPGEREGSQPHGASPPTPEPPPAPPAPPDARPTPRPALAAQQIVILPLRVFVTILFRLP